MQNLYRRVKEVVATHTCSTQPITSILITILNGNQCHLPHINTYVHVTLIVIMFLLNITTNNNMKINYEIV